MNFITEIFENIANSYAREQLSATLIISMLLIVAAIGVYEFLIYRFVSHRAFYNKSFNIAIAVMPFFISTIILCLQSSLVITLGTIGALAIIRFRTAIKDPVDMIYLLWSVHTGIMCGCQLYEVAVVTSLVVTLVIFILGYVNIGRRPFCLIVHCDEIAEDDVIAVVKANTKRFRIKSRNYTSSGVDYAIECSVKDPKALSEALAAASAVERFSIIEYDNEDIV